MDGGGGTVAAAAADDTPDPADAAKIACKAEKHEMGTNLFKKAYAAKSTAKAMAACAGVREPAAEEDAKNAAQTCKAERAADPAAFAAKYGTNGNKKNAFGKCVVSHVQDEADEPDSGEGDEPESDEPDDTVDEPAGDPGSGDDV